MTNADFTGDWIIANVLPLLTDPSTGRPMSIAAARVGNRDTAAVLAAAVLALAGQHG